MFQFTPFPSAHYGFMYRCIPIAVCGFPHSEICGSSDICSSPQLIAACHVLLRLPVPRHPPYALSYLTNQVAWRSVARSFGDLTPIFDRMVGPTPGFPSFSWSGNHGASLLLKNFSECFLVFSVRIVVLPSHFHA